MKFEELKKENYFDMLIDNLMPECPISKEFKQALLLQYLSQSSEYNLNILYESESLDKKTHLLNAVKSVWKDYNYNYYSGESLKETNLIYSLNLENDKWVLHEGLLLQNKGLFCIDGLEDMGDNMYLMPDVLLNSVKTNHIKAISFDIKNPILASSKKASKSPQSIVNKFDLVFNLDNFSKNNLSDKGKHSDFPWADWLIWIWDFTPKFDENTQKIFNMDSEISSLTIKKISFLYAKCLKENVTTKHIEFAKNLCRYNNLK